MSTLVQREDVHGLILIKKCDGGRSLSSVPHLEPHTMVMVVLREDASTLCWIHTQNNMLRDDTWDQTTGSLWGPSPMALNNILSLTHRLHAVCCGYKRRQGKKNMSALAREQGVC